MQDFKKLKVWQKSHELALQVYKSTVKLPKDELYGLSSQMRRAAVSIPTNSTEGCGREGEAELARFVGIAKGSASELEYQLLLCRDLQYLDQQSYASLNEALDHTQRMLTNLLHTLRNP